MEQDNGEQVAGDIVAFLKTLGVDVFLVLGGPKEAAEPELSVDVAEKVVGILLTADGGCQYCSSKLVEKFIQAFPERAALAKAMFQEKFGSFVTSPDVVAKSKRKGW